MRDHWEPDVLHARRHDLCAARLRHLRAEMAKADVPVMLLCDPNNIFYATGARNMMVLGMRSASRYLVLPAAGPVVLADPRNTPTKPVPLHRPWPGPGR